MIDLIVGGVLGLVIGILLAQIVFTIWRHKQDDELVFILYTSTFTILVASGMILSLTFFLGGFNEIYTRISKT